MRARPAALRELTVGDTGSLIKASNLLPSRERAVGVLCDGQVGMWRQRDNKTMRGMGMAVR